MRKSSLIILFILFSCLKKQVPDWFINPPIKPDKYYGIGSSYSGFEDAKTKALQDISSQIKTEISSSTSQTIQENSKGFSAENFSQLVDLKSNVTISKYDIIDRKILDNIYYIIISKDKNELINELQEDVNILKEEIIHKIKIIDSEEETLIKKITKYKEIKKNLIDLESKNTLLSTVKRNHNQSAILLFILQTNKTIDKFKSDISFQINYNDVKIKEKIVSELSKMDIKINNSKAKYLILFKIEIKENEEKIYEYFIDKITIDLNLLHNNEQLISKSINSKGSSSIDFKEARQNAIENLSIDSNFLF